MQASSEAASARQADDGCTQRCGDPCATAWNNAKGLLRRSKAWSLHGDGIAVRRKMLESERAIDMCVHALVRGRQGDMTSGKGLQRDRHHLAADDAGVIAELRRDARSQGLVLGTERINAWPHASGGCDRTRRAGITRRLRSRHIPTPRGATPPRRTHSASAFRHP